MIIIIVIILPSTYNHYNRSIDKKCVALDRYMKRLSKHPVVRKDAMFKAFLHEKDVAKTLKPLVTMKGAMNNFKRKFNLFKSKITVKEKDPWFQVLFSKVNKLMY